MSKQQAVKLVLENLTMLEEAYTFIDEELSPKLFSVIDKLIQEFSEQELDSNKGVFDFWGNEINFTIPEWITSKDEEAPSWKNCLAFYNVNSEKTLIGKSEDGDYFWLTTFLSNKKDRIILTFYPCWGNEIIKQHKKSWKSFLKTQNENFPQLQKLGFKFYPDELCWYLPIKPLDVQQIIACYEEENLEDAMTPIEEALKTLLEGHKYFLEIIQNAQDKRNFELN